MSEPRTVRVLLADDQRVVREGLALILGLLDGIEVVGTAVDGLEAVELARDLRPDVVLMDLRMPRCDGVEAIRRIREAEPEIKVLVLTTYADDQSVLPALRAGARGYLTKDAGAEEICRAIGRVAEGQATIDPAVQHYLLEAIAETPAAAVAPPAGRQPDGLTAREREVLILIARGLSNSEIAERLYVNESTVKTHINHLFSKIDVRDRAKAITYAYEHGLA